MSNIPCFIARLRKLSANKRNSLSPQPSALIPFLMSFQRLQQTAQAFAQGVFPETAH